MKISSGMKYKNLHEVYRVPGKNLITDLIPTGTKNGYSRKNGAGNNKNEDQNPGNVMVNRVQGNQGIYNTIPGNSETEKRLPGNRSTGISIRVNHGVKSGKQAQYVGPNRTTGNNGIVNTISVLNGTGYLLPRPLSACMMMPRTVAGDLTPGEMS
jgi:hypothetical protein